MHFTCPRTCIILPYQQVSWSLHTNFLWNCMCMYVCPCVCFVVTTHILVAMNFLTLQLKGNTKALITSVVDIYTDATLNQVLCSLLEKLPFQLILLYTAIIWKQQHMACSHREQNKSLPFLGHAVVFFWPSTGPLPWPEPGPIYSMVVRLPHLHQHMENPLASTGGWQPGSAHMWNYIGQTQAYAGPWVSSYHMLWW